MVIVIDFAVAAAVAAAAGVVTEQLPWPCLVFDYSIAPSEPQFSPVSYVCSVQINQTK